MRIRIIFFLASLAAASGASAQTATATLNAAFSGVARLSISSTSLTFIDADPDTVPQVPATPSVLTITAKARAAAAGAVTLSLQANGDLRSGVTTLPASMITWTASGSGFVNGTLSATTPQTVATWSGSGQRTGTQMFYFRNLWEHPAGVYTLTLLYTLSAA